MFERKFCCCEKKADIYLPLHSPSPVKHVPNVPRTDITKSTEDKEEKTEKPKQVP